MTAAVRSPEAPAAPASATRRRLPLGPRYEACGEAAQARPCPSAACRYHLPDPEPSLFGEPSGRPSCALDVAALGGATLEQVGELFGVTREMARVIEVQALARLAKRAPALGLDGAAWAQAHGEEWPEPTPDEPRGRNGGPRRRTVPDLEPADGPQVVLPWGRR